MPQDLERVTFNLTPKGSKSLQETHDLLGFNKTDVINRALTVYAYIELVRHNGGDILVRETPGAVPQKLLIV